MNSIVSIHAPARGATLLGQCICGQFYVSIHAPARGATDESKHVATRCEVSIHAPARGATARFKHRSSPNYRFNPRARAGRDAGKGSLVPAWSVSIHAPARGATITAGF